MAESNSSQSAQPPIGIDLGTTYSVISYLDSTGRPVSILNGLGDPITPSALLVDHGELVIGKEAIKASIMLPHGYAECFKRDMGSDLFRRQLCQQEIPPEVLSGFLLERLKQDAERRLGPIRDVVITVPAFFDETRRQATQEAGRLAGLNVLDIINEPTAAAVAFGYQHGFLNVAATNTNPIKVLVYDLGGGTFDVTILEIVGTRFRTLATDGDVRLGGKDFDERLVNYIADKFVAEHGASPLSDPEEAAKLWLDSQEAKHTLTERLRANVVCSFAGMKMRLEISRADFEQMTRDLLERTETTTALVVEEAKLKWADIDRVLLVGGGTRMPMVGEMLRRITGKEPDRSLSPDEAVAHGAALYAGMLRERDQAVNPVGIREAAPASKLGSCELVNVNSHSLGIVGLDPKSRERRNIILIPKNTPLPCHRARIFQTAKPNQQNVKVEILEGESQLPSDCIALGECIVRDLPPNLPQGSPIRVDYSYAANGRISVSATIPQTRQTSQVEIERKRVTNLESLDIWRQRLRGLAPPTAGAFAGSKPTGTTNPNDPTSVRQRIDSHYVSIGQLAYKQPLPPVLHPFRDHVRQASVKLEQCRKALETAQAEIKKALGHMETVHARSAIARAQTECDQASTASDFSLLVLGRECFQRGVAIPGIEKYVEEIKKIDVKAGGKG